MMERKKELVRSPLRMHTGNCVKAAEWAYDVSLARVFCNIAHRILEPAVLRKFPSRLTRSRHGSFQIISLSM
jgi:hypothetical protein